MWKISVVLLCIAMFIEVAFASKEKNPFIPYVFEAATSVIDKAKPQEINLSGKKDNPLQAKSVNDYILVAIMTSETEAIGLVKAPDKMEYFVEVGDTLGSEGGKIDIIDYEGIVINTGSELVSIAVSNKLEVVTNEDQ